MWRDFPERLAAGTGRSVVAYSRHGYGRSGVLEGPRDVRYMHVEGEEVLPDLLDQLNIRRPVLFGHSDGASIALIFAGRYPDDVAALVLEAPHVFVEERTVAGIAKVKEMAAESGLIARLAPYHDDPERTFRGWNDIWLHPEFRNWAITEYLPPITAPALVIQGRDDEYGTLAQLDAISSILPKTEALVFEQSGHSPHRTHPDEVIERTASFLESMA